MPLSRLLAALCILLLPANMGAQELLDPPSVVLTDVPFELTLQGANQTSTQYEVRSADGAILAEGTILPEGVLVVTDLEIRSTEQLPLEVLIGDHSDELDPTLIPGWFSVLPPVLAILLALIFREVITALFAGVWLGALAVAGFNPLKATGRLIDQFVVPALTDADHVAILVFSLLLGGMVGIVARNGGTMGIVESVTPFARNAKRGKIATWAA
ncbi:MAG: hypothetical protein CME17_09645, partial [Gemmatimonadetes bacterium]|nr:hypothetical protein [Gemmatimonadota bacterium]